MIWAAALALALPLTAQTVQAPPCAEGYSQRAADGLGLTRAQWDAACAGKPAPAPGRKAVKAGEARKTRSAAGPVARWRVYDAGGKEVLRYRDEGGPLASRAFSGKPARHPFISGSSLDANAEDALHAALEGSRDSADFRARLQQAGFLVLPDDAAAPVPPGSTWEVLKAGRLVMRVKNEPGPLVSRAMPSGPPARHPFLSGSSFDAAEEDALRSQLEASRSTAEFLGRLEKAGYTVRRAAE